MPTTARGNVHIDLFTDRFSRREDMFTVAAAVFTAEGSAKILVNHFISFGEALQLQLCARLATAAYKLIDVHKLTISAYHPSGNGGVEHVNGWYGYTTPLPPSNKDRVNAPMTKFLRRKFLSARQVPSKPSLLVPLQRLTIPTDARSETSCYTLTSPQTCPALRLSPESP